jgi:hypothetical protein
VEYGVELYVGSDYSWVPVRFCSIAGSDLNAKLEKVIGSLVYLAINPIAASVTNAAIVKLSGRIQHRAMSLALNSFLEDFRGKLLSRKDEVDGARCGAECYIRLHERLAASWQISLGHLSFGRFNVAVWMGVEILSIIVTIVSGLMLRLRPGV